MSLNVVSGIHYLKLAKEYFQDFQRQYPQTRGAYIFNSYEKKIDWMYNDLLSNPNFSEKIIEEIKGEWESDVFAIAEINDKLCLLDPVQLENIGKVIDMIIEGETIDISLKAS